MRSNDHVGKRLLPRWSPENRPYVVTSKPANGAGPEQEYLYRTGGDSVNAFFRFNAPRGYNGETWAEGTATQGCDRSADSAAGMMRRRKPPRQQHSGAKAINPRGLGTESPTRMNISDIRILSAGAIDSRCSCLASDCKHSVRLRGSP